MTIYLKNNQWFTAQKGFGFYVSRTFSFVHVFPVIVLAIAKLIRDADTFNFGIELI